MTIRFSTRRFAMALLAQVVFCLVAAPILAAEQWTPPVAVNAPAHSGPTIQAAVDAANVRPEEVSDAEQKRGKPRAGVGTAPGLGAGLTVQFKEIKSTKYTKKKSPSCSFMSFVDNSCFLLTKDPRLNSGERSHPPDFVGSAPLTGSTEAHETVCDAEPTEIAQRCLAAAPGDAAPLKTPRQIQPAIKPTGPPRV